MALRTRPLLALGLLTTLNFLNYIDRYILPAVQPLIKDEFHPSDTALGALTTVFFIFYMCSAPGIGFLADRKSRKAIITIGALIWSAATLLTAVTYSFSSLLIRHTIVGVGEATFSLIAPAYIADLAIPPCPPAISAPAFPKACAPNYYPKLTQIPVCLPSPASPHPPIAPRWGPLSPRGRGVSPPLPPGEGRG